MENSTDKTAGSQSKRPMNQAGSQECAQTEVVSNTFPADTGPHVSTTICVSAYTEPDLFAELKRLPADLRVQRLIELASLGNLYEQAQMK